MNELGQILDQQLEQLEGERRLFEEAIEEIHRRYGVLDDVTSWGIEEELAEHPVLEWEFAESDDYLESEKESLELSAAA